MSHKKYALKYNLKPHLKEGGFTIDEIMQELKNDDSVGGADALFVVSILRGGEKAHDGALDIQAYSFDGQNEGRPIPDTELFSIWAILASGLMEGGVPEWQKSIAANAFDAVKSRVVEKH